VTRIKDDPAGASLWELGFAPAVVVHFAFEDGAAATARAVLRPELQAAAADRDPEPATTTQPPPSSSSSAASSSSSSAQAGSTAEPKDWKNKAKGFLRLSKK
jgi:hypothetical protein